MLGINTDLIHDGKTFHIQTQDNGSSSHCIESLIYREGRVLTTRKSDYTPLLNSPDLENIVRQLLEEQHRGILAEISKGELDHL
ncbi:hypothetical protein ACFLT9_14520 [Acidobacteriota bacterium]